MFFFIFMNIMRSWYDLILWPTITSLYAYMLFMLWIAITCFITYGFLYKKDQYRIQYMYKHIAKAVLKSAVYGMFFATLAIGLYNMALYFAATSQFFISYRENIWNLGTHLSSQDFFAQILRQRILTVLFLIFSSVLTLDFAGSVSYQFQDHKNYQKYASLIIFGSVICYVFFMFLGYV